VPHRTGKHVLEIQGQRIELIVVPGYGESNELVAEFDGPRLVVENVYPAIDKKMEVFLETLCGDEAHDPRNEEQPSQEDSDDDACNERKDDRGKPEQD